MTPDINSSSAVPTQRHRSFRNRNSESSLYQPIELNDLVLALKKPRPQGFGLIEPMRKNTGAKRGDNRG